MSTPFPLVYPSLNSPELRELKSKGFTKIPVLSADEVAVALEILSSSLSGYVPKDFHFDLLSPQCASTSFGERLRTTKRWRILSEEHSHLFLNICGIKRLREDFHGFYLAKMTYGELFREEREEVYFRVVRPGERSDIGDFHRDHWFNEIYTPELAFRSNFKVWLALNCPPGSGLQFIPRQSDDERTYEVIQTDNGPRPKGVGSTTSHCIQPDITAGEAFVFDPFLLHRGSVSKGETNRISVELCFFHGNSASSS